jgi:tRNA(Ile)-lysidine synthetase-like protein
MGGDLPSSADDLTEIVFASRDGIPPGWRERPLALCLSGGVDSSALALIFSDPGLRERFPAGIEAIHVRHGLRAAESEGDARSVRELCARTSLPLREVDALVEPGPGLEARARAARYDALRLAAPKSILATAHHLDDQAETVVLRLLRGAQARGLAGIRPWREDGIWRPLLEVRRSRLDEACRKVGWIPRFDSSNADRAFHRNGIRLDFLPAWESESPGVSRALAGLARSACDLEPFLERALDRLSKTFALRVDETGFALDLSCWPSDRPAPSDDPELDLLLERTWTRVGRRPWATAQRQRLLSDLWAGSVGRRSGGQGEIAHFGGRRLRVEISMVALESKSIRP